MTTVFTQIEIWCCCNLCSQPKAFFRQNIGKYFKDNVDRHSHNSRSSPQQENCDGKWGIHQVFLFFLSEIGNNLIFIL